MCPRTEPEQTKRGPKCAGGWERATPKTPLEQSASRRWRAFSGRQQARREATARGVRRHGAKTGVRALWIVIVLLVASASCTNLLHASEPSRWRPDARSPHDVPDGRGPYQSKGTYDDWINVIWAFESSIDPSQQHYYNTNWNVPSVDYQKVLYPGRVVRDPATGEPIIVKNMTIQQYFETIGVAHLYNPSNPNPPWKQMQASVVNYLGFVGFQFQESDLADLGYYEYRRTPAYIPSAGIAVSVPIHYVDVPVSHWKNGVTYFLDTNPKEVSGLTVVRDTVIFDGHFLGRNGITDRDSFMDPDKHVLVIKDHFKNKYDGIVSGLAAEGKKLSDYIGSTVRWSQLNPPVSPPPGGRSDAVIISMSGLLAGAHLRGAQGVVDLLVNHQNPADENGTHILQYVQDYGDYDTPYGSQVTRYGEEAQHPS